VKFGVLASPNVTTGVVTETGKSLSDLIYKPELSNE